ncbi:hypothetical protein SAMN05443550_10980 [Pedobacter hartonius]|uniref:Uncharacterized protein n=1 Tax=Pedobacter hartonius TaxID=425514 RepID=A0A1H4G6W4_9SPHI|nr:hypothetical protein SAMN05443550_10980 [Pedobacter hartonius]
MGNSSRLAGTMLFKPQVIDGASGEDTRKNWEPRSECP